MSPTHQRLALVFLILLRMSIGWHFLFESLEKHRTVAIGPTETNRPWTSEGYFREASGPMAGLMRWKLGDVDEQALAKLTVKPVPATEDPTKSSPYVRMPLALDEEWNDYFRRFVEHYGLDAARQELALAKLNQQKEKTVVWFTSRVPSVPWLMAGLWSDFDRKPFKRTYPSGTIEVNLTVSERVEEYRAKLAEYRTLQKDKLVAMGKDVEKQRRAAARGELAALRTELLDMVDVRTKEMKQSLDEVLKDPSSGKVVDEYKDKPAVPEPDGWRFIKAVDWMTRWGLTLIGVGLLLGLFSRASAAGGALFLLMTVLTTPSLPWLPSPPMSEGNYLFVSKNVIEMFALFMLACIPTGRWFGVDALIHALNPWRKKDEDDADGGAA